MDGRHTVFVFLSRDEVTRACAALDRARVSYAWRAEDAPAGLYPCAFSAPYSRKGDAYATLQDTHVLLIGRYDTDRPLSCEPPDAEVSTIEPGGYVQGAAITFVTDCVADTTKICLIAGLSADVTEVMPYLNAEIPSGTYVPGGPHLTFMKEHRMVSLYPQRVAIAKADDIDDGWRTVIWVCRLIDDVWARKSEIEPSYEMRRRPSALEIYGWLPRTNCRACGELTCLAFAAMLLQGKRRLDECTPLYTQQHAPLRERMEDIVTMIGI